MTGGLFGLIVIVACLVAAWWIVAEFSPSALVTKLCQLFIFLIALYVVVTRVLPLAGVSF